jgi:hypothetical protein
MRVGRQAIQRIALPLGFVHTLQRASAGGVPAAHKAGSSPASAPPLIVPPTGCCALAPHTVSGSNGTTIIARPRGPSATTAPNR